MSTYPPALFFSGLNPRGYWLYGYWSDDPGQVWTFLPLGMQPRAAIAELEATRAEWRGILMTWGEQAGGRTFQLGAAPVASMLRWDMVRFHEGDLRQGPLG